MTVSVAVTRERREGETRCAVTPETVKKLIALGATVAVEAGTGLGSSIPDADYAAAGAVVRPDTRAVLDGADIVLKVRGPTAQETSALKPGAIVIAMMDAYRDKATVDALAGANATAFAMEFVPRITRAQVMDVLSSQANLAGYRAVIEAAYAYGKGFPMMMTAAGTVAAAKCFVMGVGVAGLQAIATARRLGAKFLAVEDEEFRNAQTAGGYAKPMSAEYQAKQAELTATHVVKQDVVITTALIPGRAAPILLTADHVASMKPGSVIVDLAVEAGGNVEGSKLNEVVTTANGVTIVGWANMPGRIAADASALYARNLTAFVGLMVKDGALTVDLEDEILKAAVVTDGGAVVHEGIKGAS